jgi:hypothetical protein
VPDASCKPCFSVNIKAWGGSELLAEQQLEVYEGMQASSFTFRGYREAADSEGNKHPQGKLAKLFFIDDSKRRIEKGLFTPPEYNETEALEAATHFSVEGLDFYVLVSDADRFEVTVGQGLSPTYTLDSSGSGLPVAVPTHAEASLRTSWFSGSLKPYTTSLWVNQTFGGRLSTDLFLIPANNGGTE